MQNFKFINFYSLMNNNLNKHFTVFYLFNNKTFCSVISRKLVTVGNFNMINDKNNGDSSVDGITIPDPPTNCCMSGCANCVWIEYAEELEKLFKDGGEKSYHIIMSKVDDVNMRAYLKTELSIMNMKLSKGPEDNPQ